MLIEGLGSVEIYGVYERNAKSDSVREFGHARERDARIYPEEMGLV